MTQTIPGLSSAQLQVAYSIASGASITSTAQSAGVGRSTIHHWLQTQPDFAKFVDDAKNMYIDTLRDQLRDASAKALATIISIIDDPKAPASVRLKASLAILNRPQFPDRGWLLPEKIEPPAKEEFLDTIDELKANDRSLRLARQVIDQVVETHLNKTRQNSEVSQPPLNNSGQENVTHPGQTATVKEHTPIRSNKVGRNEPCPCGSGKKFKRCCLNATQTLNAATSCSS